MAHDPALYKALLRLASEAAHEIVTRTKLSDRSKSAGVSTADALGLLLSRGIDELSGVRDLLRQASALLNRASPALDDALVRLDAALSRPPRAPSAKAASTARFSSPGRAARTAPATAKKKATSKKAASKKKASAPRAGTTR